MIALPVIPFISEDEWLWLADVEMTLVISLRSGQINYFYHFSLGNESAVQRAIYLEIGHLELQNSELLVVRFD